MVTIAQGKFSKPRPYKLEDIEVKIPKANHKPVAPKLIDDQDTETVEMIETAISEAEVPIQDNQVPETDWKDETQIAPAGWAENPQPAENWQDATQVIPETEAPAAEAPVIQNRTIGDAVPDYDDDNDDDDYDDDDDDDDDEDDEDEEDDSDSFFHRNRKPILISGCVIVLALLALIIGMVVSAKNRGTDNGRILKNVYAAGIDIGGMTPEKAKIALMNATVDSYDTKTMKVVLPDTILELKPEDTKITLDVDALVDAAFNYGRVGTPEEIEMAKAQSLVGQYVMDLVPFFQMDAEFIHAALKDHSENFNSSYLSSSYSMEGEKPGLTADTYDETVPCQTLVLKIGTPGRNLNAEDIYTQVMVAYSTNVFEVDASEAPEEMPELPDLDAIFEEFCSTPVDAYMDMQTFEVTGEIYGYTFNLEEAKKLLEDVEYGATLEIQMEYIVPEVTTASLQDAMYADILGQCETKVTKNDNRCTNIRLACQAINGLVLQPGDEFSFNDVVGKRTAERGYRSAPAYNAGKTVQELGGGICQVSSTLYYAVLLADLEVTDRSNHTYVSSYIDMGMDATVSWGGPEFKFRNNTSYPVRLEAGLDGDTVKVQLVGKDEKDYYVEMEYEVIQKIGPTVEYEEYPADNAEGYTDGKVLQEWTSGYYVDTYKHKFDKETKQEISVEFVARSVYKPRNKIIVKIIAPTEPATEPSAPPATQAPTTPPAPPATQAPTTPPAPPATQAPTTPPAPPATQAPQPPATQAPPAPESPITETPVEPDPTA